MCLSRTPAKDTHELTRAHTVNLQCHHLICHFVGKSNSVRWILHFLMARTTPKKGETPLCRRDTGDSVLWHQDWQPRTVSLSSPLSSFSPSFKVLRPNVILPLLPSCLPFLFSHQIGYMDKCLPVSSGENGNIQYLKKKKEGIWVPCL